MFQPTISDSTRWVGLKFELVRQLLKLEIFRSVSKLSDRDQDFLRDLDSKHNFDPTGQFEGELKNKCGNTALWIHNHETFKLWKDCTGGATLWLTGGPGSGKRVLTGSIIERLQTGCNLTHSPLVYYFVDGKEKEKCNPLNLFPGLIYQILRARPDLVEKARRATATDAYFSSTLEKSATILHLVITDIPTIFVFVDAIDECKDSRTELLVLLLDLQKQAKCLKLFVTSRADPNCTIAGVFDRHSTAQISLTIDHTNEDSKTYLTVELQNFDLLSLDNDWHGTKETAIKERIRKTILGDAAGMFLYASMAWSTFRDHPDKWDDTGIENRFQRLEVLAGGGSTTSKGRTLTTFYLEILNMLPGVKSGRTGTKKLFQ